jgi:hypothetical protein
MNIKDSILTGFGAGLLGAKGPEILTRQKRRMSGFTVKMSPNLPFPM